jgi:hypothetical protein
LLEITGHADVNQNKLFILIIISIQTMELTFSGRVSNGGRAQRVSPCQPDASSRGELRGCGVWTGDLDAFVS